MELSFEGRLLDVKPFDLAPGERRADVYPALAARTGIANARGWLTAHLVPNDPSADVFLPDDDAYAVVPPPRPARAVLLVTKGNWFLESLLRADDQITFDQLTPDAFQPTQAAAFDAVVLDDFLPAGFDAPDRLPATGNFLFLHRAPLPDADPAAPEMEHPPITDLDAASPLLRLVNLRDVDHSAPPTHGPSRMPRPRPTAAVGVSPRRCVRWSILWWSAARARAFPAARCAGVRGGGLGPAVAGGVPPLYP